MFRRILGDRYGKLVVSIIFTSSGALIMQVNEDTTINSWLIYKAAAGALGFTLFCIGVYGVFKWCFSMVLKK